jgi:DNA-binding response OmpR family regulator
MVRKLRFQTVPLAELSKGTTQPASLSKPIVLVVDDEAVIADTRAMILEHNGISTMVAYNGNSALEIAKTIFPDLLLADVALSGMNGIDLAMAIRQIIPSCGILLFSAQASTADPVEPARVAGQEFTILTKPIHPTELLARVSGILASRPQHKKSAN